MKAKWPLKMAFSHIDGTSTSLSSHCNMVLLLTEILLYWSHSFYFF